MRKGGHFAAPRQHHPRPKERREKEGERLETVTEGKERREREREKEREGRRIVKIRRCEEDVKKVWRRCEEDVMKMWWRCDEDVMKMRWSCEHMKMYSRPPLLEGPFAQTLKRSRVKPGLISAESLKASGEGFLGWHEWSPSYWWNVMLMCKRMQMYTVYIMCVCVCVYDYMYNYIYVYVCLCLFQLWLGRT